MTTTANKTMQQVLNGANLNWLPTLLQMMKLGNMLSPVKVSVTGLTAAAAIDITTMTFRDAATISGLDRANADLLPQILTVKTPPRHRFGYGELGRFVRRFGRWRNCGQPHGGRQHGHRAALRRRPHAHLPDHGHGFRDRVHAPLGDCAFDGLRPDGPLIAAF